MAKIVVSGYMIRHPVAGNILAFFHYILGLHRLGHEVLYIEESGWANSCYDPETRNYSDNPHPGLKIVQTVMAKFHVHIPVCYVNSDSRSIEGLTWEEMKQSLDAADLLLNIGGVCWLPEFYLCHRRALIDMDPLFTQVGQFGAFVLKEHHIHFSYGSNIGRPGCTIPTGDINWLATIPPVVPEIWNNSSDGMEQDETEQVATDGAFTTIANWSAYGSVTYNSEHYGQKNEEFMRLRNLPQHTSQKLELALSGANDKEVEQMRLAGWFVRDFTEVSTDVLSYQNYIAGSRGEFSAAKHAYVKTRSGWFSDRSVCYLAAGRPTILQDTGFSDWLPTGRGVLSFSTLEEAVDCIESVNADYPAHCHAARETALQTFSYKVVLPKLLDVAMS